ncbi:MAG: hypothetical protein JWQ13_3779 [Ramlibacter sp.]|jgi:hypothetical protein|nr:hypothetical protein [Ramlibacter sp.]
MAQPVRFPVKPRTARRWGQRQIPSDSMQLIRTTLAILAAATLAACATQTPVQPGKHMLVRDLSDKLLMQFDYPTDELCAKTAVAMRGSIYKAGCSQTSSAEPLNTRATLRYTPPGVMVQAHYLDMALCRRMNAQMSAGVELLDACKAK